MKRLKVFYLFTAILLSGILFSCDKEDFGGNNNLSKGQIEMKITPDNKNKVEIIITAKKITIDWGDGSVDELTPGGIEKSYTHEYFSQNIQTIKINTEGLISFGYDYKLSSSFSSLGYYPNPVMLSDRIEGEKLHELRFGNCPELKSLNCGSNELTILDLSKCTELTDLIFGINKLTSLDLSRCKELKTLTILRSSKLVSTLDLSKCTALVYINIWDQYYYNIDFNTFLNSLPTRKPEDNAIFFCRTQESSIVENKGWTVIRY